MAAPFLGSIVDRSVSAASAAPPRRLIVMFTHHGCVTTRFFPAKSHGALTAADLAATTLKPLAPYVDKLLIPRGIRAMNEWTTTMKRGQGNDPHTQVCGSYFTCQPVTPNSDDPFASDSATKLEAKPIGRSLDHVMAEQLSPRGFPLLMLVGNFTDSPQTGISYSAATTPYAGFGNASYLYGTLTGLFTDGPAMSPDSYQALRGKNVLDLVKDDLETLERFEMSRADLSKLEAWKALLSETTNVMRSAACNGTAAASLGVSEEYAKELDEQGIGSDPLGMPLAPGMDGADFYSNLAALSAVCNANPVIFLKYPAGHVFRSLGLEAPADMLAGRTDNLTLRGTCIEGVIESLVTIDDYYARKFAYLVGVLNSIQEGEGSVLDGSAAVWFQQFSDGCAMNLNNLPIVQVGSAGGYFRTGCAINVEDQRPDLTTGNSEGFCTASTSDTVDATSQESGTPAAYANAPINKYYCSLMNALGVKAGEDGFALKGGSAPVTHFGMYDRTEDFIHGGTNPPRITSPGEFATLKASS